MYSYPYEFLAIGIYFCILFFIGYLSYKRDLSAKDFMIGGRAMNYWLTALSAHASDMSSWLFIAYPSTLYLSGLVSVWTAIGLFVFMFLNWQFVAPKIRVATEQYDTLTFSSYFESRLGDTSGTIRIFTALILFFFYTPYISSGLIGLGILLQTLFQIKFTVGVTIGLALIIPYVFIGGYRTLAWIDLFQGLFLMCVIIFVPLYVLPKIGGFAGITDTMQKENLSMSLIPKDHSFIEILLLSFGWGLGYFGQPHIVTKFMGIRNVSEISKSKMVGMTWMFFSLGAATLVGLVGIAFFQNGLKDPQHLFIEMVRQSFPPFIVGLFLCAILAATINALSSMVLVLSSSITEDFYKRIFHKKASSRQLLWVSRTGVILVSLVAFIMAYDNLSTIYALVLYSWSGIGSSFGPLILLSLYSKSVNKYGAWAGVLSGGITAGIWPYLNKFVTTMNVPSMIPGFIIGTLSIILVSRLTKRPL